MLPTISHSINMYFSIYSPLLPDYFNEGYIVLRKQIILSD